MIKKNLYNNKKRFLFRCDAGKIPGLGTGHLIRSLTLAKILIINKIAKKKQILFLSKLQKKHSITKKILKNEKIKFRSLNNNIKDYSKKELDILKNCEYRTIIFDRLGLIPKKFIHDLKKSKKKIILFDDGSKNKIFSDLSINSLVSSKINKKGLNGFKFMIMPSIIKKFTSLKSNKKIKIFVSFGGYDHNNLTKKICQNIHLYKKFKFYLDKSHKKNIKEYLNYNNKNIYFYERKNFFYKMSKSDLIICSGGLTIFDAIKMNIPVLAIPQYKHQLYTIKKLSNLGLAKYLKNNTKLSFELKKIFSNIQERKFIFSRMIKLQKKFFKKQDLNKLIKRIKYINEN